MNEDDFKVQSNIQDVINANASSSSYALGPIPVHEHNGSDSPEVSIYHLDGTLQMVTSLPTNNPNGFGTSLAVNTNNNSIEFYDFTNKAWKDPKTPRVVTITTAASYTINTDIYDALSITALAGAINTIDVSGTPVNFQKLIIRIKDNGGAQNITWSTNIVSYGSTLPTTTTAGKITSIGLLYDSVAAKWGCVAVQTQP